MNQIIYYKVLKLFLIAVFTKIGFGSTTQNNTKLIVIAISEPYAINPFKDNLFYLQSGISFKSLSETEGYKYLPDFGFGYKISKAITLCLLSEYQSHHHGLLLQGSCEADLI